MKKFYAILVVLALVMISSMAMAEVTVSGSIDIRNLATDNASDQSSKALTSDKVRQTGERVRLNVDAKNDGVKGRISLENDWEYFGTEGGTTLPAGAAEAKQGMNAGKGIGIREAWIDATIPGAAPAHFKVGHQFLQLGNGWFFRSMKYGSDAWLVGLPGKNTIAFVDVKLAEAVSTQSDDIDALVLLDNFKIDDTKTVGVYWAHIRDPRGILGNSGWFQGVTPATPAFTEAAIENIGLWFNGKVGPINLQAEIDIQSGKAKALAGGATGGEDVKFKGNQIVLQANMPMNALTINATIAQGSGDKSTATKPEVKSMLTALDADPHYTFVYEYFTKTACAGGGTINQAKNTGFCNTQALGIGAAFNVSKSINVAADIWMLNAVEKVSLNGAEPSTSLGNEIDVKANFKLYDQLTWNWTVGYMMPGKAYDYAAQSADTVTAVQGILSYKF